MRESPERADGVSRQAGSLDAALVLCRAGLGGPALLETGGQKSQILAFLLFRNPGNKSIYLYK